MVMDHENGNGNQNGERDGDGMGVADQSACMTRSGLGVVFRPFFSFTSSVVAAAAAAAALPSYLPTPK